MEIHQNRRNVKGLTRLRTASDGDKDDAPSTSDDHSVTGSAKIHLEDTNGFQLVTFSNNTTPKRQPQSAMNFNSGATATALRNDSLVSPPRPVASFTPTHSSRPGEHLPGFSTLPHSSYVPSSPPTTPSSARALLSPTPSTPNTPSYRSTYGRSTSSKSSTSHDRI